MAQWIALAEFTDRSTTVGALAAIAATAMALFLAWTLLGGRYEVGPEGLTLVRGPFRRRLHWSDIAVAVLEGDEVVLRLSNGLEERLAPRDAAAFLTALRPHVRQPAPARNGNARHDPPHAVARPPVGTEAVAPASDPRSRCRQCGAERPADARFCPVCGAADSRGPRTVGLGGRLYELATFRRRLGAFGIDSVMLAVTYQMFTLVVRAASPPAWIDEPEPPQFELWELVIPLLGAWLADAAGWTPGKALVGLRVLRVDGHRPGPVHGLVRSQARILGVMGLGLGYLWAAWDGRRQAWHDKFASTYVVRVGEQAAPGSATRSTRGSGLSPLIARRSAAVWFPAAAVLAIGSVVWIYSAPTLADTPGNFHLVAPGSFHAVHPLPPAELRRDASLAEPVVDEGCPGTGRRICMIPVGEASIADTEVLAAHFRERYDIPVATLPVLRLDGRESFAGELVDERREQLDGPGVLLAMRRLYPNTLSSSSVVVIGVTAYDMFTSRDPGGFSFLYSARDSTSRRMTLVSTARIEPAAWGDEADESLRMERARKLVAREIGGLYYGLGPSEDPRSVMQAVLSPLSRLDHVDETLPLHELDGVNPDLIRNLGIWEGRGPRSTALFELDDGEWEYCATIKGALTETSDAGLRVTAYTEAADWIASTSGYGRSGSLGCASLTAEPGRLFFRIRASGPDLGWSVTVRRPGGIDELSVRTVSEWHEYPAALMPSGQGDGGLVFESVTGSATERFWSSGPAWSFCWEIVQASGADAPSATPLLEFAVTFEDDLPVGERWRIVDAAPGESGCIDVEGPNRPGRYRLLVMGPFSGNGWRVTIPGAQLD